MTNAQLRRIWSHRAEGSTGIGPLEPGHRMARKWTFTAKRWREGSYLWRHGNEVLLSFVWATHEGRGYLRDLIAGIEAAKLRVVVPNPLGHMTAILEHYGFVMRMEPHDSGMGDVDVWRKVPPNERWLKQA